MAKKNGNAANDSLEQTLGQNAAKLKSSESKYTGADPEDKDEYSAERIF